MPERPRMRVKHPSAVEERVMLSSAGQSTTTAGALASRTWLRDLGLTPPLDGAWRVDLELRAGPGAELQVEIADSEWGIRFTLGDHSSWIRVKVIPFVHDRDDFSLLHEIPPLRDLGVLIRRLERKHAISFKRSNASVQTSLTALVPEALRWLASL